VRSSGLILIGVSPIAYFSIFEGSVAGATVGKRLFRIRVVDDRTDRNIGYWRALLRTVARIVSIVPFYAGVLWAFVDERNRTWHDLIAHSVVLGPEATSVSEVDRDVPLTR
jgi:uncharacterized RDD family membrane protein YckC